MFQFLMGIITWFFVGFVLLNLLAVVIDALGRDVYMKSLEDDEKRKGSL